MSVALRFRFAPLVVAALVAACSDSSTGPSTPNVPDVVRFGHRISRERRVARSGPCLLRLTDICAGQLCLHAVHGLLRLSDYYVERPDVHADVQASGCGEQSAIKAKRANRRDRDEIRDHGDTDVQ